MNTLSEPAVFLGCLHDRQNPLQEDYFSSLKSFFQDYKHDHYIVIESTDLLDIGEYAIFYGSNNDNKDIKASLEGVLNTYLNLKKLPVQSSSNINYYCEQVDLERDKIVHILIKETDSQKLIDIGKELLQFRKQGYLLIGLGNLTQKDLSSDLGPTEEAKEFDAWLRIKLWEFDYYSIRDIDTYFPIRRDLYQEKKEFYGSFLVIFGSLEGTDIIYDIFAGFDGNNSLRSFYFSPNVIN